MRQRRSKGTRTACSIIKVDFNYYIKCGLGVDVQDIHFDMMFPNFDHDYLCGEIGGMDLEFDPTQWSWSNLKTL